MRVHTNHSSKPPSILTISSTHEITVVYNAMSTVWDISPSNTSPHNTPEPPIPSYLSSLPHQDTQVHLPRKKEKGNKHL
ncbi:hypothetical protein E2C01_053493 [Portunus trituberculatus]|uniref:Uncharacterized protein n=1 Tax=Portunus trituberculatus TaxID=210409 RepID=A0A5B7GS86_PORTR|nr:hypothetical protein [Portunus trituberculatus]